MLSAEEIERLTGISQEQVEEWERQIMAGNFPGEPVGEIIYGRPLLYGEEMRVVGFKEPVSIIERMDKRAAGLGMKRSEYLRRLVAHDLIAAGM